MSASRGLDHTDPTPSNDSRAGVEDDAIPAALKRSMISLKALSNEVRLEGHKAEVPKHSWEDQYVRMSLWAADIGAHGHGEASLAFRLRQSPDVAVFLCDLITDISSCVEDVLRYLDQDQATDGPPDIDSGDDSDSDPDSLTMLQELYTSLETYITSLLRVSTIIHNSANYERAIFYDKGLVDETAPFFVDYLREKFPDAEEIVLERLGTAIARRRGEIEYRLRQSEKRKRSLARFMEESLSVIEGSQGETRYSDYAGRKIDLHDDARSVLTSMTGYSDLETATSEGRIQIPRPPSELGTDMPFECPYCFKVQRMRDIRDWQRHVFRDSLPYICVCSECGTADTFYTSRREYFKHLGQSHAAWMADRDLKPCLLCKKQPMPNFMTHLSQHLLELALFSVKPYDAEPDDVDVAIEGSDGEESDGYPPTASPFPHLTPPRKLGSIYVGPGLTPSPAQRVMMSDLLELIQIQLVSETPLTPCYVNLVMAGKRKEALQPTLIIITPTKRMVKHVRGLLQSSTALRELTAKHGVPIMVLRQEIQLM